jgi:hypothetical protein
MSYLADSRRNLKRKIVTQRSRISLAQDAFLREQFQRLAPEKSAYFAFAEFRRRRLG